MLDSLTRVNSGDFQRRYMGTYGWLVEGDKKSLVYIHKTDEEHVYFRMDGDLTYHARRDSGVQFEFIPVNRGWFNTHDNTGVYYMRRYPARQWKRGICTNNTQIWMAHQNGYVPYELTWKVLESIFKIGFDPHNPTDISKRPVALSKDFAIIGDTLWFNDKSVGTVNYNEITLENTLIEQELRDLIRRRNYNLVVKVDHDAH